MSAARLVVVAGLMASGKSTVARRIAAELDAELLVADEIRREDHEHGDPAAYWPGFGAKVYGQMFARARELLGEGRAVVLDATFRTRALRAQAAALAKELGVPFQLVECRCDESLCRQRLAERPNPEGWLALFDLFLEHWEPVSELAPEQHARADTSKPAVNEDRGGPA